MNRVLGTSLVALALSSCGSYEATSGRRFADAETAIRASAEHDLRCASGPLGAAVGHRSGHVSSDYWRISACGHELFYREVPGGFGRWRIMLQRVDGRTP